jgi:hypothetical protein
MTISADSGRGRFVLMIAHCAGMVDLVSLSVWVGALTARYGFDPQRAGGLPTLFLTGAVLASLLIAPRIQRLPERRAAGIGFGFRRLPSSWQPMRWPTRSWRRFTCWPA